MGILRERLGILRERLGIRRELERSESKSVRVRLEGEGRRLVRLVVPGKLPHRDRGA